MGDSGLLPAGKSATCKLISFVVPPLSSHLIASMGVARKVQALGHRVEFWGDAKIKEAAERGGFGFRSLEGLRGMWSPEIDLPRNPMRHPIRAVQSMLLRRQWKARLLAVTSQLGTALDRLLVDRRPDLVVFDPFRLAYYPFVHRRGVAACVLSTKALATPDPGVPPHTSRLAPRPTFLGRLLVRWAWLRVRWIELGRRSLETLAKLIGVYTYDDLVAAVGKIAGFAVDRERVRRGLWYDVHFKSVPEWVLWTPAMDFPRLRALPANIRYIGPCVDLNRSEAALTLRRRSAARHLIYVAVGTSVGADWHCDVAFLAKVVSAFQHDADVDVWVSTGDERVTRALGEPPPHVCVFDTLPQLAVLDLADLCVTHAGAGTLRECIMKTVPMLAYPRDFDQFGNSARIVHHGLGLRGDRRWDSSFAIRQKAMQILQDDRFRDRLRTLRSRIAASETDLLAAALAQSLRPAKPSAVSSS